MAGACGVCTFADRDFGILMASVSVTPNRLNADKVANAWARLTEWVTHVRGLPDPRAHLAEQPQLTNLSGTAYLGNVLAAVGNPKLQEPELVAMNRAVQDQVIASALVLIIGAVPTYPLGPYREWTERIARSWGWKGPPPGR